MQSCNPLQPQRNDVSLSLVEVSGCGGSEMVAHRSLVSEPKRIDAPLVNTVLNKGVTSSGTRPQITNHIQYIGGGGQWGGEEKIQRYASFTCQKCISPGDEKELNISLWWKLWPSSVLSRTFLLFNWSELQCSSSSLQALSSPRPKGNSATLRVGSIKRWIWRLTAQ